LGGHVAFDISRRMFINALGSSAGAAGLHRTFGAMGLLPAPVAYAGAPQLSPDRGRGSRVVILGAGIAGMTAGYRLRKAGYDCVILEARDRPGGRVWTLRGGDEVIETKSEQRVGWDRSQHLYFEAGASRISQHHTGVLDYCREFNIPLETYVSDNRAALLQTDNAFGGKPQSLRQVIMDGRGGVAALAAIAAGTSNPDILAFLAGFGALQNDLTYTGTGWAGYTTPPGGGLQAGEPVRPLPLDEIAKAVRKAPGEPRFLNPLIAMIFSQIWDQSPTMLQPVGGMVAIPRAFARSLGSTIRYQAQVLRIERAGERARVIWRDRRNATSHAIEADFVICTMPLPVLRNITADFSQPLRQAIDNGAKSYVPAGKIAFYSARRWWETDYHLYGGISWTSRDITQIWYPSHGFHEKNGIIMGGYMWDTLGETFAQNTPAQRIASAIRDAEGLHPGYASLVDRGVSVAWPNIPFSEGGWCEWSDHDRKTSYPLLVAGEGPFSFAGEHVSYIPGWQEGAIQSAHHAIQQITRKSRAVTSPH
jgi:monoamine oxidase